MKDLFGYDEVVVKRQSKTCDTRGRYATLKGFISVSNVSNSKGKDYSVQIDNLAHTSVGGMDIAYLHELQHIVWDCLKVELKIEL